MFWNLVRCKSLQKRNEYSSRFLNSKLQRQQNDCLWRRKKVNESKKMSSGALFLNNSFSINFIWTLDFQKGLRTSSDNDLSKPFSVSKLFGPESVRFPDILRMYISFSFGQVFRMRLDRDRHLILMKRFLWLLFDFSKLLMKE